MALSKTLRGLIERAERNGSAVKRVRENQVMGGHVGGYKGDLIEQWRVDIIEKPASQRVMVFHYGTKIADIESYRHSTTAYLDEYYGESVSDRDALNGLCDYYGINRGFSYRPSTGDFIEVTEHEDIGQIQRDMAKHAIKKIHEKAPWIIGGVE